MNTKTKARWSDLLEKAVSNPGTLSDAYSAFYGYSIGNQFYVHSQCDDRDLPIGPIASYKDWQHLGRQVTGGQKALNVWAPFFKEDEDTGEMELSGFYERSCVFVLSQTDGDTEPDFPPVPDWDRDNAFDLLDIENVPFDHTDGNCQGFAKDRVVAINPVAKHPLKTLFHEFAHVLLGHTSEGTLIDNDRTPRSLREVEAESVAMICCDALKLDGDDICRGYIQNWWGSNEVIPEDSARKIFTAANKILEAGRGEGKRQ